MQLSSYILRFFKTTFSFLYIFLGHFMSPELIHSYYQLLKVERRQEMRGERESQMVCNKAPLPDLNSRQPNTMRVNGILFVTQKALKIYM